LKIIVKIEWKVRSKNWCQNAVAEYVLFAS
jgi:hypothetical protein